jgi:hypothetical protein
MQHEWERRGIHRLLVGKPEGKRLTGRPRPTWIGNIKMDLREIGKDMDEIGLT